MQEQFLCRLHSVEEVNEAIPLKEQESEGYATLTKAATHSSIFPEPARPESLRQRQEQDSKSTKSALSQALSRGMRVFITRKFQSISEEEGTCNCQLLRSGGLWSIGRPEIEHSIHDAYLWQIAEAKHFIYIENQFFVSSTAGQPVTNQIGAALAERIKKAHQQGTQFKVVVVVPLLPGFEGSVEDSAVLRVQLHYQYSTICRGGASIYESLREAGIENPELYIRFYGLRTHDMLSGQPVTEMIYVHSKLMIVDDRTAIIGSANINDRSLLGSRDSELVIITQDDEKLRGVMGGQDFEVSKFAHSLRMQIFKEHSGEKEDANLIDPLGSQFAEVWEKRASINTRFYRTVFRCYPDDGISRKEDVESFMSKKQHELYSEMRESAVGHLVEFPLRFLEAEDLQIRISNKEYFLPEVTFT